MTRALPRTNFNSSRLLRLLGELALIEPQEAEQDLAERLGQWLDFTDAIALFAAHNESAGSSTPSAHNTAKDAEGELTELRSKLTATIRNSCAPTPPPTRIRFPIPRADLPLDIAADYEPYRRFYLAHQRDIETALRPLRTRARAALAGAGAACKTLAAIDEVFERILTERESKLLVALPVLLEKRFAYLRSAHLNHLGNVGGHDDPAAWLQPGAWLAEFRQDIASVLLAELELRLQPTLGLLEATRNEKQHSHD
jgi:hypothetical protein